MRVPAKSIPPTALSSEKRPDLATTDPGPLPLHLRLNIKCISTGGIADQHSLMKAFLALALVALASSFTATAQIPTDAAAEIVLGQADFSSADANRGSADRTAATLSAPAGLTFDSAGHLWVADHRNDRVVGFTNAVSLGNGPAADAVIEQVDFDSSTSGLSATKLNSQFTSSVYLDAFGNLWTTDNNNDRALRFTRPPTPVAPPDTTRPAIRVRGRKSIETLRKRFVKFRGVDATGNRSKVSRFRILRR